MTSAAEEQYQAFLDRNSKALMAGDFDEVAAQMVYPHSMKTLDGEMLFETPEQLAAAAQDFHTYLTNMGTRDYFRLCKSAAFTDETQSMIVGSHETYILQGAQHVVQPFRNEMTLKRVNETWKGSGVRALVDNISVPILSPRQLRERALGAYQRLDATAPTAGAAKASAPKAKNDSVNHG